MPIPILSGRGAKRWSSLGPTHVPRSGDESPHRRRSCLSDPGAWCGGNESRCHHAASQTSRSQLYHYFVDKDALISEVIKTQLGRVIAAQEPRLREVSSWDGLQRWCDQLVATTRTTQASAAAARVVGE